MRIRSQTTGKQLPRYNVFKWWKEEAHSFHTTALKNEAINRDSIFSKCTLNWLFFPCHIYSVVKVNSHYTILLFQVGGLCHIMAAFTDGPGWRGYWTHPPITNKKIPVSTLKLCLIPFPFPFPATSFSPTPILITTGKYFYIVFH